MGTIVANLLNIYDSVLDTGLEITASPLVFGGNITIKYPITAVFFNDLTKNTTVSVLCNFSRPNLLVNSYKIEFYGFTEIGLLRIQVNKVEIVR